MKRTNFFGVIAVAMALILGVNLFTEVSVLASELSHEASVETEFGEIEFKNDIDYDLNNDETDDFNDDNIDEDINTDEILDDEFSEKDSEEETEETAEIEEDFEIMDMLFISAFMAEGEIRVNSEEDLIEAIEGAGEGDRITLILTQDVEINNTIEINENICLVLESEQGEAIITQRAQGEPHFRLNGTLNTLYFEGIILDGNGQGGGITVENNSSSVLYDIHIRNSAAEQGGAVRVYDSNLVLSGGIIEDNEAEQGGGIFAANSLIHLEDDVIIRNNRSYSDNSNVTATGGGIAVTDNTRLIIEGALVDNNEVYAQNNNIEALGGGIYIGSDSKGEIEDTVISKNNAEARDRSRANYGAGGGIAVSPTGELEFNSNVIIGGYSAEDGNSAQIGGGIYYQPGNKEIIYLSNGVKIYHNKATYAGTPSGGDKGNGGGILFGKDSRVIIEYAEIMYNSSAYHAGGIDFSKNTSVTMQDGKINNNTTARAGGGIQLQEDTMFVMEGGTISYNEAESGLAGGIYAYFVGSANGFNHDSYVILNGGEVSYNKATVNSGGVYGKYVIVNGGSINNNYVERGLGAAVNAHTLEILSGTISHNEVKANASNYAGVILCYNFIMRGGEISNNVYNYSGTGIGGSTVWVDGEEYLHPSSVLITGGTIRDNKSTIGGAVTHIYEEEPREGTRTTVITGGEFIGNEVTGEGGALYVSGMPLEITGNTVFQDNKAADGGAVYVEDLTAITVGSDVVFENNQADSGWWMTNEEDIEIHLNNIETDKFSSGFIYGFNNYDVFYQEGHSIGPWKVEYNLNYDENEIYLEQEAYVTYFLEEPEQPAREGYDFTGWYKEWDTAEEWNFDSERVFSDMTLYAGWIEGGGNEGGGNEGGGNGNGGNEGGGNGNGGNEGGGNGGNEGGGNGNGGNEGGRDKEEQNYVGVTAKTEKGFIPVMGRPVLTEEHRRYVQGYPDNSFQVDNSITRAEIAMIFYNLIDAGDKDIEYVSSYEDVEAGTWYYNAVAYLEAYEIVQGYPDGTFRPNAEITRAELSVIASVFFDMKAGSHSFADVSEEHWANDYIANAYVKGWIQGYPDGTFRPDWKITRGETVTMINAILGRRHHITDVPVGIVKYNDLEESHWAYADVIEASYTHEFEHKEEAFGL